MGKTTLTYGTFDMFHIGHLKLLRRLSNLDDDWEGEFDFLKELCEAIYLERTKDISTTQLKKSLTNFLSIPKEDILNAFNVIETLKKTLSKNKIKVSQHI